MFGNYMYPFYRSPYYAQAFGFPVWNMGGYSGGFGRSYGTNIFGSAIANQSMNVIGTGAIGGSQVATPTAIW